MGLDISAFRDFELLSHEPTEEDYDDGARWLMNYSGFSGRFSATPIVEEKDDYVSYGYAKVGRAVASRGMSYGGYNLFRRHLARAIYNVKIETIWTQHKKYSSKPFYEQLNFADNEGCMDSKTCAKLAKDYADHREAFAAWCKSDKHKPDGWRPWEGDDWLRAYDDYAALFAAVGPKGFALFH